MARKHRRIVGARPRLASALGAIHLAAMLAAEGAAAGDWDTDLEISEDLVYDDNLFLRRNGVEEVYGAITRANVGYRKKTPASETAVTAGLELAEYWGGLEDRTASSLDHQDPRLGLVHKRKGQGSQISFGASFERRATLQSELEDSGRLVEDEHRDSAGANIGWASAPTRQNQVSVSANVQDVSYSDPALLDRVSYGLAFGAARRLSERHTLRGSLGGQVFETANNAGEDDRVVTASVGLASRITPALETDLYLGLSQVYGNEIDRVGLGPSKDNSLNVVFGGTLNYEPSRRLRAALSAGRTVSPSSTGLTQVTWRTSANLSYRLTESLSTEFNALYFRREDLFGTLKSDRDYFEVGPRIVWDVAPRWSAFAGYRFRSEGDSGNSGRVESSGMQIGLRTRWP